MLVAHAANDVQDAEVKAGGPAAQNRPVVVGFLRNTVPPKSRECYERVKESNGLEPWRDAGDRNSETLKA